MSFYWIIVEDRPRKKDAKTIPDNDEPVDENDATEEQPTVIKKDAGDKKEKIKEADEEKDQHQPPDVPITPIVARPMTSDVMPSQLSSAKVFMTSMSYKTPNKLWLKRT